MNSEKTTRSNWQGIVPRGRQAIISVVAVAVVAFSLGGLLLGGGETNEMADNSTSHADSSPTAKPILWTCSMHPQIRLPKPGKCPICFMDLIPVETGHGDDSGLGPDQLRLSETAVQLARIETSPVTRAFAERSIRMVGKLDYDETRVAYITAWVPGRLDKLYIDFTGATVTKGDRMALMYSPNLVAAQEELVQAQKAIQALNQSSSDVLKSTAKETLRSAREKLRLYGLSDDQIKAIESEGVASDHLTITAPTSGVVVMKDAKEGMYVSTGSKIFTIADLSKLWVMLEAYESDLPWLRNGQHLTFTSSSFPGETFEAVISFIDPVVDPKTRTVHVRAIVNNADGRLKPEMFVSGTVKSRLDGKGHIVASSYAGNQSTDRAPLLIPATAPLLTGKRAVVYVEVPSQDGHVFEGREVTLGPKAENYYVVKEGLSEGEQVVTKGAFRIDSELQIQAKPSMMSPEGGAPAPVHQHGESEQVAMVDTAKAPDYKAGTASRLDNCEEAQVALAPVYRAYLNSQMALAKDDLQEAKKSFGELVKSISGVDMSLFKDKAHTRWMEISQGLASAATNGQSAETLAAARDAFYHASLAAIELHDTFGHAGGSSYYLTFCPMARDKAGAYWLQAADTVWNSFYGEAMQRCGEIKQELHAGNSVTE